MFNFENIRKSSFFLSRFSNQALKVLLHVLFWFFSILIFGLLLYNISSTERAILRSLFNGVSLAILFYFNAFYLVNKFLEKGRYFVFGVLALIIFILSTEFRVQVNYYFPDHFNKPWMDFETRTRIFSLASSFAILMLSTLYQILQNRNAHRQYTLSVISEYQEAQLQFLKAQINPHFLFNTLNNIYALAIIKSDETPDMILKLADLLRYVIYEGKQKTVTLEKEAEYIQKFIDLFQIRNEHPVDISFEIQGDMTNKKIEPMILIPLVENCFKHCDFDTNPDAFTRIILKIENEKIRFSTLNTKDDTNQQKDKTGGVGLENIQKRLELNYPEQFKIVYHNNPKEFEVILELKTKHV